MKQRILTSLVAFSFLLTGGLFAEQSNAKEYNKSDSKKTAKIEIKEDKKLKDQVAKKETEEQRENSSKQS